MGPLRPTRERYPTDVGDEEWAFLAPSLALLPEAAPQRDHPLREVSDALKWLVRAGAPWRLLPHDFPPWWIVHQQSVRWLRAGVLEAVAHDPRLLPREAAGRGRRPTAAILDSRTLRSTPESGPRAGYDGAKRKRGSKLHMAVDTLGHLLALHVTPANADDRAEVGRLAQAVQDTTGDSVDIAFVDAGYNGPNAAAAAQAHGIELVVVKLPEAKKGFVLLPRRWVIERSFGWTTRFRRLVRDYERYASTLAGLHFVAFVCLMLQQAARLVVGS